MRIAEPGDVKIVTLELKNKTLNASISPLDQIIGFDVYEDMAKPTLFATFTFSDNIGLIDKFPIIGEEEVIVEFQTPGLDKPTKYVFKSYEVANVQKEMNGKGVMYTLKCVSEEHLYNGGSLVTRSYTDIIGNIVPSILSSYLKTEKPMILDQTKGIQTLAFPKLNPLQSIDMCRQRAVSKDFPTSSYVFFENQDGFNFKTIEGLIKDSKPTIGSRVFNAQQDSTANKDAQGDSFRTIQQYESIARADSNSKAAEGVFKAVTKTFDLATKTFSSVDFDMRKVFNSFEAPSDGKQIPNSNEFIEKYGSGTPKTFFAPRNSNSPDNFIDTMIATRNAFSVLLNSDVTRVKVYGDSGLKVGTLITMNLPEASGTTGKKQRDQLSSGNYMIVRLRHMITTSTKSKHEIVFDAVKMGV